MKISGGNDFKTLRISDSKDHSTIVLDNISTSSEKEEELTRDQPEKWVPVKKPKSNEKSQKGPKIIHERSVSWEDVDLSENQGNILKGIVIWFIGRELIKKVFSYVLFSVTHFFIRKQNGSELHFFIHNFFQKLFSEWKPYMANIVCKS